MTNVLTAALAVHLSAPPPGAVVLIVLTVALPLAITALCLADATRRIANALAPWAATPALALALTAPDGVLVDLPWALLGVQLGLQPVTRLFLLFTALLWLAGGHFAHGYLRHDARRVRFTAFFMLTLAGNLGLIVALDLSTFYLFFALMTFAAYGLVIHSADVPALRAGRVYIVMAVLGEGFLLAGLVAAAHATGSLHIAEIRAGLGASPLRDTVMALLLIGFGVKAGLLGVHLWLPLAHPVAPTPASAVLSGAMIKAGLLGWLLFLPLDEVHPLWLSGLTLWGLAAAFFGVAVGVAQRDPKAILAYSSISQMGLMLVALTVGSAGAVADTALAAFYAAHHGLAKAALFLGVAVVAATARSSATRYAVLLALAVPALALIGAPWTSGAVAKGLLEAQLAGAAAPLAWAKPWLSAAAAGTGVLLIRLMLALASSAPATHADLGPRPLVAWLALSAASALAAGWLVMPWATPLGDAATMTGEATPPLAALLPLLAAALLVLAFGWMPPSLRRRLPRIPAGDMIALLDAGLLQQALRSTVLRVGHASARVWGNAVQTERRARRRLLVEIGREEFAFPVVAGVVVLLTVSALLAASA